MGVAVEGGDTAALPMFDRFARQTFFIDVFNQGIAPFIVSADVIARAHAVRQSFSLMRLRRSQVRIVLSGTAKRVASSS